MKNIAHRRLSAAVLAGAIALSGFGFAAPAQAAEITAASYLETLTASTPEVTGMGYGQTYVAYFLDVNPGSDYTIVGKNISTSIGGIQLSSSAFLVTLTDQPQIITHLAAKHKDGLVGADKLIQLENPLIVPAYMEWPAPVLDSRIVMPEIKMAIDAQGYTTFEYDKAEIGTSSADLERVTPYLEVWADGVNYGDFGSVGPVRCDELDHVFDGKDLTFKAGFKLKADDTARYNEVTVSCPAFIPLAMKLSQNATTASPGDTVTVTVDELEGTYGKAATIAWKVDGKTVDGVGNAFIAPEKFTTIEALVTGTDREGETLTKKVGWAHFTAKPPVTDPATDPTTKPVDTTDPVTDPTTKPVDDTEPVTKPVTTTEPKPVTTPVIKPEPVTPPKVISDPRITTIPVTVTQPKTVSQPPIKITAPKQVKTPQVMSTLSAEQIQALGK